MRKNNRIKLINGKKADIPGWAYVVGMIIGLVMLIILIWIAAKSGKVGLEQLTSIQ